jgi:subtilisin family serine protease
MPQRIIIAALSAMLFSSPVALAVPPDNPGKPQQLPLAEEPGPAFAPDSILVRFGANASDANKSSARGLLRATMRRGFDAVPGLEHMMLGKGVSPEKAVEIMNRLPFVEYAHPNYLLHVDFPPDDEYWLEQWSLDNAGQASLYGTFLAGTPDADVDWLEARTVADGTGVVIAVADTGIDYRHTDIAANVWINDAELNGSAGVDDDGNGYIDDVRGWDFVNNDPSPLDGHGHGTMVAGVIGAITDNTKGIAGMMPGGKVMALKIIGDDGTGELSMALEGIQYALDNEVRISNHSWGYTEMLPEEVADHNALHDLIQAAQADDHLFIASAGNGSNDTDIEPHYPSSFALDNIISVGATDNNDALAWFSSFGATSVHVSAPGDAIMSTHKLFAGLIDDYSWESGTSFSAPIVASVAGLVLQLQPNWSYAQIRDRVLSTSRVVPALAGKSATGAIVNVQAALAGLPEQVVDIDVLPGDAANVVYPNKNGKLPVAVLGSAEFDATQVDPATLSFGPAGAGIAEAVSISNVDGLHGDDTVARFNVEETGIACNDTEVGLSGETYSGQLIVGTDTIDATQCEAGGCHAY